MSSLCCPEGKQAQSRKRDVLRCRQAGLSPPAGVTVAQSHCRGSGWGSSLPRAPETFPRRPSCLLGPGRGGALFGSPVTVSGLGSSPGITGPLGGPGVGRGPSLLPSLISPSAKRVWRRCCLGDLGEE